MRTAGRPWIVTPHEPIAKHEDNLWTVAGQLPGAPIPRRMSIVRRRDGSLVFHGAIVEEDAAGALRRAAERL